MSTTTLQKALTPSRLIALLSLLTVTCAVLIAAFTLGEERAPGYAARATRINFVHQIVESADNARQALREYEVARSPEAKAAFLTSCDSMAATVTRLRHAEQMSEEESDQITDLCIAIRQQLNKIDASPEESMLQSGNLLDRIRRVVLGFGMDDLRLEDEKLAEQTSAAALGRRITAGMAVIEIFLVAGIVILVMRLSRLEKLVTVCAWSHRVMYEGQWVSLERYLENRFGIRASEGISTEQAAKLMAEPEINGQELVRLVEFEKAAGVRAKEANKAIHAVRNHLTAVLCYSEMAGTGDPEAQSEMASRVLKHANTISSQVDVLHKAVRGFNPGPPDLHIVRDPEQESPAGKSAAA
jgi:hypothetical protein